MNKALLLAAAILAAAYLASGGLYQTTAIGRDVYVTNKLTGQVCLRMEGGHWPGDEAHWDCQ